MPGEFSINYDNFKNAFYESLGSISGRDLDYFENKGVIKSIFDDLNKAKAKDGGEEVLDINDNKYFEGLDDVLAIAKTKLRRHKQKCDPVYDFLIKHGHGDENKLVEDPEKEDNNISLTALTMKGDTKAAVDKLTKIVQTYRNPDKETDVFILGLAESLKVLKKPVRLVDNSGNDLGIGVEFNGKGYHSLDDIKKEDLLYEITRRLNNYELTLQRGNTDFINPDRAQEAVPIVRRTFGLE